MDDGRDGDGGEDERGEGAGGAFQRFSRIIFRFLPTPSRLELVDSRYFLYETRTMFISNPLLPTAGPTSIVRRAITCAVPAELSETVRVILEAMQLLTALRDLQRPEDGSFHDDRAAVVLKNSIAEKLRIAAGMAPDESLREVLSARATAFEDSDFRPAALLNAQQLLPVEVIIGTMPSWRFPSHARLFSGIVALPTDSEDHLAELVDGTAHELARHLSEETSLQPLHLSKVPPALCICDLLATAGDALGHPLHIANFLPDDEGVRSTPSMKSLVYRNLYSQRYVDVSLPLLFRSFGSSAIRHAPQGQHAWLHLIAWFRGHDIGHLYFDHLCKALPGLPKYKRYILQETLADLFGLLTSVSFAQRHSDMCSEPEHAVAVFLAEALRYTRRDRLLFPDAASGWLVLNSYLAESVVVSEQDLLEISDVPTLLRYSETLLTTLAEQVQAENVTSVERFIDQRCGFAAGGLEPYPESLSTKLYPPQAPMEVDALFETAETFCQHDTQVRVTRGTIEESRHVCRHT